MFFVAVLLFHFVNVVNLLVLDRKSLFCTVVTKKLSKYLRTCAPFHRFKERLCVLFNTLVKGRQCIHAPHLLSVLCRSGQKAPRVSPHQNTGKIRQNWWQLWSWHSLLLDLSYWYALDKQCWTTGTTIGMRLYGFRRCLAWRAKLRLVCWLGCQPFRRIKYFFVKNSRWDIDQHNCSNPSVFEADPYFFYFVSYKENTYNINVYRARNRSVNLGNKGYYEGLAWPHCNGGSNTIL